MDIFNPKQLEVPLGLSYCSDLMLSIRKASYVGMFIKNIIVTREIKI